MSFFYFIIAVVVLFLVFNLRSRVQKLESLIKSDTAPSKQASSYQPIIKETNSHSSSINNANEISIEENKISTTPDQLQQPVLPLIEKIIEWLKEDWILKLGALLLIFGFGWLTTYAFINNWIGPAGRIALGVSAGLFFMLIGWWRIQKYINQGGVFLVLGSTTILLTIFAAREIYGFFTPTSALLIMFISAAFVALASVKYNSRVLSLIGLGMASIAPLLVNFLNYNYIALFSYLLIVILGTTWIVFIKNRQELILSSLIIVFLYSLSFFSSGSLINQESLLFFAYAFVVLFFITNTFVFLKNINKEISSHLITAVANGLFLFVWITNVAPEKWQSLILLAWMLLFVIGGLVIFKITKKKEVLYVYMSIGIALLATATALEFEGAMLTIVYTIQGGIIALMTYLFLRDIKIAQKTCLLLIGPILLSFNSIMSKTWNTSIIHKDFLVLIVLAATLLGLGALFASFIEKNNNKEIQKNNAILLIIGSIYLYILLWLSLHTMLASNTAVIISLVVYTIIGITFYFYGLTIKKSLPRFYGGTLVMFVVARLLLVDISKMEISGRIITFFLIGALLVSTAFLGKKKRQ